MPAPCLLLMRQDNEPLCCSYLIQRALTVSDRKKMMSLEVLVRQVQRSTLDTDLRPASCEEYRGSR